MPEVPEYDSYEPQYEDEDYEYEYTYSYSYSYSYAYNNIKNDITNTDIL